MIDKKYRLVICGGTFDHLHEGHKAFLRAAFIRGERVIIGLTSYNMIKNKPFPEKIQKYEERLTNLIKFLKEENVFENSTIVKIDDPYGPSITLENAEAIIVTEETKHRAYEINKIREKRDLKKLEIVIVPFLYGSNGKRISSSQERENENMPRKTKL
ncbi:MAG: phosphopantetheine adenylyltransferase [Candidatus Wukongarchaeota archaeon]|nr:pantetheine-phosphate adenylyltransferase [Candidatus Wukongarchaeota archaeon]